MFRLAVLLWVMLGTTFAGICVLGVLMTPSLQAEAMRFIPIAALVGALVGVPVALVAAKSIAAKTAA